MKPIDYKNRTVLITGASSGIGKEFAKSLAEKGANLIITARSEVELVELARELESKYVEIWVKVIPIDLTHVNAAQILVSKIKEQGLSVSYLINNAGFGKFCEFPKISFETYHQMLMLNINALVELTHLCLPEMLNKDKGGVINVASTASFQPLPYQAVYGASKAFVLSFSEAISGELLDTNIRIMALCPGQTESRFMANADADTSQMKLEPASSVVKAALIQFDKNRMYTVSGTSNYLTSLVPRLVSRKRIVKIVVNMFKDMVLNKSV